MLADAKAIGVACGGANALQIEANASGANKEIRDDMTVCFVCAIGFQQVQLNCQQLETDSWWLIRLRSFDCWFPSLWKSAFNHLRPSTWMGNEEGGAR